MTRTRNFIFWLQLRLSSKVSAPIGSGSGTLSVRFEFVPKWYADLIVSCSVGFFPVTLSARMAKISPTCLKRQNYVPKIPNIHRWASLFSPVSTDR